MVYHLFLFIECQIENYLSCNFPSNVVEQCMYPEGERKEGVLGLFPVGTWLVPPRHLGVLRTFKQTIELCEYNLYPGVFPKPCPKGLVFLKKGRKRNVNCFPVSKAGWDEVRSQICGFKGKMGSGKQCCVLDFGS